MPVYSLKVATIRKETNDCLTISFKQPALKKITYKAGQFISLVFRIKGRKYVRSYSFSSAPGIDALLELTVKRVPQGIVSDFLFNELQVGDILEASGPFGSFTYAQDHLNDHIILWAAGSGITPLISILKKLIFDNGNTKITLVYASQIVKDTVFLKAISEIERAHPSRFTWYQFYSREDNLMATGNILTSRINAKNIEWILLNTEGALKTINFICGPNEFKEMIILSLNSFGVKNSNIFIENFVHVINQEELKEITDQEVTIRCKQIEHKLTIPKGKSILDVALDHNIEMPYSCQTGSCEQCKILLKQGHLKTIGLTALPKDFNDKEFLACCAYPISNCEVTVCD